MRGRYVCRCCACGKEKGTRDSNQGWVTVTPRGEPLLAQHYCDACGPRVLVRGDEVQSSPGEMAGLRIFVARDVYMMLATMRSAAMGFEPRSTMGWEAALRVAPLVGFVGLQPALPCREFGFVPREIP